MKSIGRAMAVKSCNLRLVIGVRNAGLNALALHSGTLSPYDL